MQVGILKLQFFLVFKSVKNKLLIGVVLILVQEDKYGNFMRSGEIQVLNKISEKDDKVDLGNFLSELNEEVNNDRLIFGNCLFLIVLK